MMLLTKAIKQQLPPLYAQDGKGGDAVAYLKLFTPDSSWTWYITEYDGKDTFFGLIDAGVAKHDLQGKELGYSSLSEITAARGRLGLPVERDKCWRPRKLRDIAPELYPDPVCAGKAD